MIIIIISLSVISGSMEFLYHGSYTEFKILEPFASHVISPDKAVFATPNYIDAVIYSAQWTDYNFAFGSANRQKYLTEMYDGALDKLNKIGYIHYVDKDKFHNDDRLPKSELISYESVDVIKCEKINV